MKRQAAGSMSPSERRASAKQYVREVIEGVFDPPKDVADEVASMIVEGVMDVLVDWGEKPALHKDPSPAQTLTFQQALERATDRRRQVLTAVIEHYDDAYPLTTSDYIEQQTGLPHQTVSAVLNWLEKEALLIERDHSIIRETSTGGKASPYCPLPEGQVAYRRWGPLHT